MSSVFMFTVRDKHNLSVYEASKLMNELEPKPKGISVIKNTIVESKYDLKIIIPVHNDEKYIVRCMQSIISQKNNYKVKVIVINDGSVDNSDTLLEAYKKFGIDIYSQKKSGVSVARNNGLRELDSKYLMFIDADDSLAPDAIEKLMGTAYKYNADIVEGSFNRLKRKKLYRGIDHIDNCSASMNDLYGFPWGKVIKANLFKNLRFPVGYWFEDTIMSFLVFSQVEKVVTIKNQVYVYTYNPLGASVISKKNTKCIDTYWITELMLEEIEKLKIDKDERILKLLLEQVILNFRRTRNTDDIIKKAIFTKTRYLLMSNLTNFKNSPLSYHLKELYFAIIKNDYKKYYMLCALL